MSKYYEYYKIVDEIENNLRMDLIEATSEYEIIEGQEPLNFYNLGILFPQCKENSNNPQDELEDNNYQLNDISLTDDTEEVDTISYSMKYKPSAMRISLVVPSSACNLDIIISFGKYQRKEVQKGYIYERFPIYVETTLHIPDSISYVKNNNNLLKDSNVGLYCYVRKIFKDNSKLITISLINEMVCSNKLQLQNENSMFQCKLKIISEYDFMPISDINSTIYNAETLTNLMLYRDIKNYAIGHGCATKIISSKYISSDFLPSQEVVQLMPRTITKDSFLKLETYENNPDRNKLCMEMEIFILEYQT